MKKLAVFLIWGAIGALVFFVVVVWLAGQARNDGWTGVSDCSTAREAKRAVQRHFEQGGMRRWTGYSPVERGDHVEVKLYDGLLAERSMLVYPDCTMSLR